MRAGSENLIRIDERSRQTFITGGNSLLKVFFTSFHDLAPLMKDKETR
jgi:hypothetical protein